MSRPQSKYVKVDASSPQAAGQCDRCSQWWPVRELIWQDYWAGPKLYNSQLLVCSHCYDIPNEQYRTIILEPDPPPILNSRVPNFAYEESTVLIAQFGASKGRQPYPNSQPPWGSGPQLLLCDQTGEVPLIMQYLTSS
jgi:hypothetical protein